MIRFATEEKAKDSVPAAVKSMGDYNTFKVEVVDTFGFSCYAVACYSPQGNFNAYY